MMELDTVWTNVLQVINVKKRISAILIVNQSSEVFVNHVKMNISSRWMKGVFQRLTPRLVCMSADYNAMVK